MNEVELIQAEIDRDEYELERLVKPGSQWFDAGAHEGLVIDRITELGGVVKGFAESDATRFLSLRKNYPYIENSYREFHPIYIENEYDFAVNGAKIDIQGDESCLMNWDYWDTSPSILIIEWHTYANNIPSNDMVEILEDNGYFVTVKPSFDALDRKPAEIIIAEKLKR